MPEADPRQSAAEYFQQGYAQQMAGQYRQALESYTRSIEAFPTAEAYTFRGWTHSLLGDYEQAIAECLQAIKLDPEFGNPYNDVGAYLMEQERWDEAIPWFEKAIAAKRYEARCYPHFNLGRIYERNHDWQKATECYAQAALARLRRLKAAWN
jgi:tetratricopeptide (TPR) repeat protein